jgi:hypothetical protein
MIVMAGLRCCFTSSFPRDLRALGVARWSFGNPVPTVLHASNDMRGAQIDYLKPELLRPGD